MTREFILVDFENVQPERLGALRPDDCQIKLFAGEHQKKVDLGLVQALQQFGRHAEFIRIIGRGKDALDFHIAFYIGRLSAAHPGARFTIVSRDTGFDPLVQHVNALGIDCRRIAGLGDGAAVVPRAVSAAGKPAAKTTAATKPAAKAAPAKKAAAKAAPAGAPRAAPKSAPTAALVVAARGDEALKRIDGLKSARPGTVKTLRSSLKSWLQPVPDEAELDALVAYLQQLGRIVVSGSRLSYPPRGK
jgi:hypothetical protein